MHKNFNLITKEYERITNEFENLKEHVVSGDVEVDLFSSLLALSLLALCGNPAQALFPKRAVVIRARAHDPLHGANHAKVYTLPTAFGKEIIVSRDECTTIVVAEEVGVARASR